MEKYPSVYTTTGDENQLYAADGRHSSSRNDRSAGRGLSCLSRTAAENAGS